MTYLGTRPPTVDECTMLGKILGLLREMKIAEALGASASSDAYNVAYLLVITLFGLFSSACLMKFIRKRENTFMIV